MTRLVLVVGLFGAALLSGAMLLVVSNATVVPMMARGAGPEAVSVTPGGWLALVTSVFGTGGFTLAGIVAAIAGRLGFHVPNGSADTLISEVVELTASFTALMHDKTNRAFQRRFFFALVDAARLIQGCETSHENGVVVIKYSGYANPVAPTKSGAK